MAIEIKNTFAVQKDQVKNTQRSKHRPTLFSIEYFNKVTSVDCNNILNRY